MLVGTYLFRADAAHCCDGVREHGVPTAALPSLLEDLQRPVDHTDLGILDLLVFLDAASGPPSLCPPITTSAENYPQRHDV